MSLAVNSYKVLALFGSFEAIVRNITAICGNFLVRIRRFNGITAVLKAINQYFYKIENNLFISEPAVYVMQLSSNVWYF